jgi:hypothetical protein
VGETTIADLCSQAARGQNAASGEDKGDFTI